MGINGFDPKNIDAMTGVYTKEYFYKEAEQIISANLDMDFCIVEIDVNRLTMINDMFGLSEGDRLLKYMANTLKEVLCDCENAIIARVHADLFVFLCPYTEKELKKHVLDIEKYIAEFGITLNFELLISFGVYIVNDRKLSVTNMVGRANLALKSIKGNYAKHVAYFDEKMHDKLRMEMEIASRMNSALKNSEFEVYFQPKHSIDDKRLIGAEALVRWNTKEGKQFSPGQFIPIFEANGFIMELDKYVWEQTCIFISDMQAKGKKVPPISVNISRVDLFNPELVNMLVGLLKKYSIDPKMLKLEFTETSYAENEQMMLNVMEQFHQHGMEVEMDDFGSGYSSLNMLKDVPIDGLKVDLRFLSSTKYEKKSRRILTAVIHMSKWLGIPCIVEGVETEEQLQYLKSIGCTMVQGFYFAKPMRAEDFVEYMDNHKTLHGDVVKTVSESVLDPDKWWEVIRADCEPVLEMSDCFTLCDRADDDLIETIMASDSYYELIESSREEVYNTVFNVYDYVHEDDKQKVRDMFNSVDNYHTIGRVMYRRLSGDTYRWFYLKVRLLEKNDTHGVYFCVIDNVTDLME